ncbi:MAG: FliI/YscN family ATPase [Planctomycetes bacterium]|nr:FliI/YscN family ATPase [Planctomycetota bacterium]
MNVQELCRQVDLYEPFQRRGKLRSALGLLGCTVPAAVGEQCEIVLSHQRRVLAEVIGFSNGTSHVLPYEHAEAVRPGMPVIARGRRLSVPVGESLRGRVLDGLGRPLDGRGGIQGCSRRPLGHEIPSPLQRAPISEPFVTGQRAIDGLLTCGRGQRIGIFGGSGVGKSTLLGEIAKGAELDVTVIALIGERGREVRPFLEDCLGPVGLTRSVVIVATAEQPALLRVRAAQMAITVAEYFRERGRNVLLMLDSLTRLAMAQRELGLLLGEPPSARGYTPSVFQLLAGTMERLGNAARGSITGIMTVLVEGDDFEEPISDAARALVDGHIVLDRRLAERGHYPAINIARSLSRVFRDVTSAPQRTAARKLRGILATHAEVEDLVRVGAYVKGTSPQVDKALELLPVVETFLRQEVADRYSLEDTRAAMEAIAARWPF